MPSKDNLEFNSDRLQLFSFKSALKAHAKIIMFTFYSHLSFVPLFLSLSHSHNSFYYGSCVVHQTPFPPPPVPPSCREVQQDLLPGLIMNDYINYYV